MVNKKAIGLMAQLKEVPSNVETKSSKTIHGHQLCMMYTCVLQSDFLQMHSFNKQYLWILI